MKMEEAHYDVPWEFVHRKGIALRDENSACGPSIKKVKDGEQLSLLSAAKELRFAAQESRSPKQKLLYCEKNDNATLAEKADSKPSTSSEAERSKMRLITGNLERSDGILLGKEKYCERSLIHYDVDRFIAENRLMNYDLGAFLVRLRQNNSLALSIRASKRVLHIKLELHNNRWVLGEGPSFGSISSAITFYRTHELPIRGEDHVMLTTPILATDSF